MGPNPLNLSVTVRSAKAVCSQRLTPLFSPSSRKQEKEQKTRAAPTDGGRMEPLLSLDVSSWGPWTLLLGERMADLSGRHALGLFHDRKAHAGLMTVLFRDRAPGILRLLPGLERALHLGRTFHQPVEVHRTELAADHPEIAAVLHDGLLLFSRLNVDVRSLLLELRGFGRIVQRRGR